MEYTSDSMAKKLILDRTVSVEMFFEDTAWPSIMVEGKVDTGADKCSIDETLIINHALKLWIFESIRRIHIFCGSVCI